MSDNTSLPVTLKTRLGPNPKKANIFEILDAAQSAGAKALIVHARYTSQMHGGNVHLGLLEEVVGKSRIPVVGNGSVVNAKTAAAMEATGVSAIMIGRAALSNPWIFSTIKASEGATGECEKKVVTTEEFFETHLRYLLAFRNQLAEHFPGDHIPSEDAFVSVKAHIHLFRYFNGRPGAAEMRRRLNSVRTLAEVRELGRLNVGMFECLNFEP